MALPAPGDDRAAIVTGASSGIGEAIARELARRGYQLVLVARDEERLGALAADLGARAHAMPVDLSCRSDRAALPDRVAALGLTPDILVNNAGVSVIAPVSQAVPEEQLNLIEVDVAAVVDLCSRFLPGMLARGRGAVLNVSSLAGFSPLPGQAAYGAAKAFVLSYTQALRTELHRTGVVATALCPGPVATGFDEAAGFTPGERRAAMPAPMWKSVDQVARAGIDGLAGNKDHVIPGGANRLIAAVCRTAPHGPLLRLFARRGRAVRQR